MRSFISVLAAVALLAACGSDDSSGGGGGGTTVRCLWVDDSCNQITGAITPTQQADMDTSCTGNGGTFAIGTCDTAGTVPGYCYYSGTAVSIFTGFDIAGATMNEYYYTAGAWTLVDAQAYCASDPAGTWTP